MSLDAHVVKGWIEKGGYDVDVKSAKLLRVRLAADFATKKALPPLFVQLDENWVVLSALPVEISQAYSLVGVAHALLSFNRKIMGAKFALGDSDEVILCAELPTESLDESEVLGAIETLLECLEQYGDYVKHSKEKAV